MAQPRNQPDNRSHGVGRRSGLGQGVDTQNGGTDGPTNPCARWNGGSRWRQGLFSVVGQRGTKPSAMTPESRDAAGMSARAISSSQTRLFLEDMVIKFDFGHRFLQLRAQDLIASHEALYKMPVVPCSTIQVVA